MHKLILGKTDLLNNRRRCLSEEMVLSCIAFKRDKKTGERLLSGSRYDSVIERLRELRTNKIMDHSRFMNRGDA